MKVQKQAELKVKPACKTLKKVYCAIKVYKQAESIVVPVVEMYNEWNFSTSVEISLNVTCNRSFNENVSKVKLNFSLKFVIEKVTIANSMLSLVKSENCVENHIGNRENCS